MASGLIKDMLAESAAQPFADTHWSVVLMAGSNRSAEVAAALEQLCRTYWHPLYCYVRRRGFEMHDAQDLTQEFFARLLARNDLCAVNPAKGKFRSFLLASMNHFLANEWDRVKAAKRGGNCTFISLDDGTAETCYLAEAVIDPSAERMFERRWAVTMLDQAFVRLREECAAAGKADLFAHLNPFLAEEPDPGEYAAVAATQGWTQSTVAVAVHRLRQRFRELVREEIAHTVASPEEIPGELQQFLAALQRV
jgi:RNA polymerase sigma-70 factor (ECF subfamily)